MHLFFDLDGTLTDSCEGIVRCIQHALAEVGAEAPRRSDLTRYVGPPLADAFASLLDTNDPPVIERAIAAYRARYEQRGILENAVYAGVSEALGGFVAEGYRLGVVTSKPRLYAERILQRHGLAGYFACVYGPQLDDRHYSKEALIRTACSMERVAAEYSVMIGDRAEDILGARRNSLRSVAVTWGYGSLAEIEAASPDYIAHSVEQLASFIRARLNPQLHQRAVDHPGSK